VSRGYIVTGWVRNEADGSVTLAVQGQLDQVDGYLGDLRGRMSTFIRAETSTLGVPDGRETGFEVRR